jgi:hypothetical protein
MVAGAALTLYGLNRWRRGGWLLAAGGVLLFGRGKTGHCYTYDLLGVSTADGPQAGGRTYIPVDKPVRSNAIETRAVFKTLCEDDRLVTAD